MKNVDGVLSDLREHEVVSLKAEAAGAPFCLQALETDVGSRGQADRQERVPAKGQNYR